MSIAKEGFTQFQGKEFYLEVLRPGVFSLTEVRRKVSSFRTRAGQLVEVIDLEHVGRCLFIERIMMLSLNDEFIYHEVLVHPVLLAHPNPRDVLIIGGGDGGALREVLKHPFESVDLVELDPEVVELFREKVKEVPQGAFESDKLNLIFMDGRKYVEECDKKYDVVIVDLTDPKGPSAKLYTLEFYQAIRRILREDGLMVTHSEGARLYSKVLSSVFAAVKEVFPIARLAKAFVPSFKDEWTFSIGSLRYDPASPEVAERLEERGIDTRFYSKDVHQALFTMDKLLERCIASGTPNRDDNPVEID